MSTDLDTILPPLPGMPELPPGVDPLELTKAIAASAYPIVMQALSLRAVDDTISTSNLLSIAEHFYKASGHSAKTEPKDDGGRFVFTINLGGNSGQSITIEGEKAVDGEELPSPLANLPSFFSATGNVDDLIDG